MRPCLVTYSISSQTVLFFVFFPKKFFVFSENSKKFTITTKIFQLKLTNQTDPKLYMSKIKKIIWWSM